jgi:Zn-dependent peptidase ImmA (M78 family)/transcriptional regulator with XRE-family HTH domain
MIFNPSLLILARESRGLTQTELAQKALISQAQLSKIELGLQKVSASEERLFSEVLRYPISFFYGECELFKVNAHYYRKKMQTPKKVLQKTEALMNICKMNIDKLLISVEIINKNIPAWDVEKDGSAEQCANFLREFWHLPKGKIENLIKVVEKNGILVFDLDMQTDEIDAMSVLSKNGYPIIFLNRDRPADRQRFNLAHELGHLLMHFAQKVGLDRDVEQEAHEFASAFLLPKSDISYHLQRLDLAKLADLKRYWKVSMAALLMRAKKIQGISEDQYKRLWKLMAVRGYKTEEPVFFDREKPTLVDEIISVHQTDLQYSSAELAKLFNLHLDEFEFLYLNKANSHLRIVKSDFSEKKSHSQSYPLAL